VPDENCLDAISAVAAVLERGASRRAFLLAPESNAGNPDVHWGAS